MEGFVKAFLQKRGYDVNETAQTYIKACEDWYSNKEISSFHCRNTVQGTAYKLQRLNFAKRCCSDDANLCEVLEINAGPGEQNDAVNDILNAGEFQTQYRKQLEKLQPTGRWLVISAWTTLHCWTTERQPAATSGSTMWRQTVLFR